MIRLKNSFGFLIGCLLVISASTDALARQSNQAAHFTADSVKYFQKTGNTIFTGHVIMQQNHTTLKADQVTVFDNEAGEIRHVIAVGRPAYYRTIPKHAKTQLVAVANRIDYYPILGKVVLTGDAVITKNQDVFKGPYIVYNIKQQTVTSAPKHGLRTTIVIPAKKITAETS